MLTPEDLKKLAEPFHSQDLDWRIGTCGKSGGKVWALCFPYLTARAVMRRLDDVCGPGNWQNTIAQLPAGGFVSGISILVARPDGTREWITKYDGAEPTAVEPVKGGLSAALKRAAVLWGLGRLLYELPDCWAIITDARDGFHGKLKDGTEFRWYPPPLPKWALPGGEKAPDPRQSSPAAAPPPDTKPNAAPDHDAQKAAILEDIEGIESELPPATVANLRKRIGGDLAKASLPQLKALLNAYRDNQVAMEQGGAR